MMQPDEPWVASGLSRERFLLADWQARRLAHTYADLRADPRYAPATEFFLTDLYGPRDFSKRDADGERVAAAMHRVLPESAIRPIEAALVLNRLTHVLDAELAQMLFEIMQVERIDAASYAEAYRRCDQYTRRKSQIEQVDALGRQLDHVVAKPMIQLALRLARGPAHLAGLGELQDFLERGVRAFLHMSGASAFLDTIRARESDILTRIFDGDPAPFDGFE